MEKEKEIVKIMTHKGRIITLTISKKTLSHLEGTDKFGSPVILPREEIKSMYPIKCPPERSTFNMNHSLKAKAP